MKLCRRHWLSRPCVLCNAQGRSVFQHWNTYEVLSYLDADDQADVVADLSPAALSDILDEMAPDDAADVLGELPVDQALHAANDSRAYIVLDRAHARLQERASRITDAAMRRSFLEHVPYHREIVAAWATHVAQEGNNDL